MDANATKSIGIHYVHHAKGPIYVFVSDSQSREPLIILQSVKIIFWLEPRKAENLLQSVFWTSDV